MSPLAARAALLRRALLVRSAPQSPFSISFAAFSLFYEHLRERLRIYACSTWRGTMIVSCHRRRRREQCMVHVRHEAEPYEGDGKRKAEALAEIFEETPEVQGRYTPLGKAELADHDARGVRLKASSAMIEVTALAPDLFRVGMFPESRLPRYDSEAIAKKDWESVAVKMSGEEALALSTEAATACISRDPLRISF